MSDYETAWRSLEGAARDYASTGDMVQAKALADAASAYARARDVNKKAAAPAVSAAAGVTLPFGRERGRTVAEAETENLQWMAGVVEKSIDAPDKANFRAKNETLLAAIRSELASRGES